MVVRTLAGLRAFEGRCPHQGALLGPLPRTGHGAEKHHELWQRRQKAPLPVGCPLDGSLFQAQLRPAPPRFPLLARQPLPQRGDKIVVGELIGARPGDRGKPSVAVDVPFALRVRRRDEAEFGIEMRDPDWPRIREWWKHRRRYWANPAKANDRQRRDREANPGKYRERSRRY